MCVCVYIFVIISNIIGSDAITALVHTDTTRLVLKSPFALVYADRIADT